MNAQELRYREYLVLRNAYESAYMALHANTIPNAYGESAMHNELKQRKGALESEKRRLASMQAEITAKIAAGNLQLAVLNTVQRDLHLEIAAIDAKIKDVKMDEQRYLTIIFPAAKKAWDAFLTSIDELVACDFVSDKIRPWKKDDALGHSVATIRLRDALKHHAMADCRWY